METLAQGQPTRRARSKEREEARLRAAQREIIQAQARLGATQTELGRLQRQLGDRNRALAARRELCVLSRSANWRRQTKQLAGASADFRYRPRGQVEEIQSAQREQLGRDMAEVCQTRSIKTNAPRWAMASESATPWWTASRCWRSGVAISKAIATAYAQSSKRQPNKAAHTSVDSSRSLSPARRPDSKRQLRPPSAFSAGRRGGLRRPTRAAGGGLATRIRLGGRAIFLWPEAPANQTAAPDLPAPDSEKILGFAADVAQCSD